MPSLTCTCGARYRFDASAVGKRAKCKKCGAVFTLEVPEEKGVIPFASEPDLGEEVAEAARRVQAMPKQGEVFRPPGSPAAAVLTTPGGQLIAPRAAPASVGVTGRSFASDVLWTFLFPSKPGNLIAWIGICIVMGLAPMAGCVPILGLLAQLLIAGWFAAFRFEVVASAAGGDDDLPDVQVSPDALADLTAAFFKWLGTWLIVLAPAYVYAIVHWNLGNISGVELFALIFGGVAGMIQTGTVYLQTFTILAVAGMFFWPMVVLCVALDSFGCLIRLDLIALTIARTFPAYLPTIALMMGAAFGQRALMEAVGGQITFGGLGALAASVVGLYVVSVLLEVYLEIVLMRLIGLYYFHFKSKFAWSWE